MDLPSGYSLIFPQWNYGQGSGAWNPATAAPIYQQVEKARIVPDFALVFAADILFGKERSGDSCYVWEYGPNLTYVRAKYRTRGENGKNGWLYNQNSLNASKSGVPQFFGPPAVHASGAWRYAVPCTTTSNGLKPPGTGTFTFVAEDALSQADIIRQLNAGHCSFSAADSYGVVVCVPYATTYLPQKQRRARPECGNSKTRPIGSFYR